MSRPRSKRPRNSARPAAAREAAPAAGGASREAGWWLLWLVFSAPICFRTLTSSDTWWHLHWGRWWWKHWRMPDFSQFYFTPVQPAGGDFRSTLLGDLTLFFTQ